VRNLTNLGASSHHAGLGVTNGRLGLGDEDAEIVDRVDVDGLADRVLVLGRCIALVDTDLLQTH